MKIQGKIVDADKVVERVQKIPQYAQNELNALIKRLAVQLSAKMKDKLSDQVLHVRSGTLRRSISIQYTATTGTIQAVVGTNLKYGAVHEYGWSGTQTVQPFTRTVRQVFGKSVSPFQQHVSGFSRHVNFPERSFARSSLQELESSFSAQLSQAVKNIVDESKQ